MDARQLVPVVARMQNEERARRRLLDFAGHADARWRPARHLALVAEQLERLERREIRRLAICMPPRHGKSELVSRKFVAWYLGRHPEHHVILASYGAELAEGNSRAVRTMIQDEKYPFADIALRDDSASVARWETRQGGVVVAVGVNAGLTGRGGDLIVNDDLVKDRESAESEAVRKSTRQWFSDVLLTRANPDAAIVLIGTRWHAEDILSVAFTGEGAERWETLVLPLIAEEGDPLGRRPGELLWPERFGPDDFPSVEKGDISSRSFAALYQQRPTPAEGSLFKAAWFEHRYEGGIPHRTIIEVDGFELEPGVWSSSAEVPIAPIVILSIDAASKTGALNDWSVIETLASDEINLFVVDVLRERLEFGGLCRAVLDMYRKWGPSYIFVEDASAGTPLIQELRRTTSLPIVGVPPRGSKIARCTAVTHLFESGRVKLPERAPWLDAFVDEMLAFPVGRHDDQVDATTLGIAMLDALVTRAVQARESPLYISIAR